MRFKLYREYGALNSQPIFNAVEQGLKLLGHQIVDKNEDVPVIWSVLWYGRMKPNKFVYEKARSENRPVMIIEVGNLFRNKTWRISLNHVNGDGVFGNRENLDNDRPKKLQINLKNINQNRKPGVLIAGQHFHSLQWQGMPALAQWATDTINKIRQFTDRPIIIRPHPRCPFSLSMKNIQIKPAIKIPNSYDDFDIDYNFHCVINYNAGPAVRAAIEGTPIICHTTSLAHPVSDILENIEKIQLPEREQWFLELCHTEWTVDELKTGLPFRRLDNFLINY